MATDAFIGGITVGVEDAALPGTYNPIEESFDLGGLGQTNALIAATHFASGGFAEYIAGLADGEEVTITCNKVQGATEQAGMVASVKAKETRNFEVKLTDGTTEESYTFAAVCLAWVLGPVVDDRNTIEFTVKISGDITQA